MARERGRFVCCTISSDVRQHLTHLEAGDVQTLPLKRIQARIFATKFLVAEQARRERKEREKREERERERERRERESQGVCVFVCVCV
jgi:hypothetical protein